MLKATKPAKQAIATRSAPAAGNAPAQRVEPRTPRLSPPAHDDDWAAFSTSRSDKRPIIVRRRVNGKVVKGHVVGGTLVPMKASGKQTRTQKVNVIVGGFSETLRKGVFDQRSAVGKRYTEHKQALIAHLGGDVTVPQQALLEQAARLHLINDVVWTQLYRVGVFDSEGTVTSGFDAYLKAARELRSVLDVLGIERKQKPVPVLSDYIEGKARGATVPRTIDQQQQPTKRATK